MIIMYFEKPICLRLCHVLSISPVYQTKLISNGLFSTNVRCNDVRNRHDVVAFKGVSSNTQAHPPTSFRHMEILVLEADSFRLLFGFFPCAMSV